MSSQDVDGVLEAIDGALEDWTSPDAMRWSPQAEQQPLYGGGQGYTFAFHDEEGRLVVTSDAELAAGAPGPISIGFDWSDTSLVVNAPRVGGFNATGRWINIQELHDRLDREAHPREARRMWLNGWDDHGNPR